MGHHHHHGHCHHGDNTKNIRTAFFLNLGFTVVEIVGGLYTNSLAILSDALHDLGDSFSLGLSWYFQKLSGKKSDKVYTFGYKRFSLLGAIVNSIILFTGSIFMLWKAIPGLLDPVQPDAGGMIGLAILGVAVNGAAVFKLKKGTSLNERSAALHLLEDVLGWIAVLIGSIVMHFWDFPIIDPLLSVGISFFILSNVYKSIKESVLIILQQAPSEINTDDLKNKILQVEGISSIHDLHLWTMDGQYNVLTFHAIVPESKTIKELSVLKKNVLHLLKHEKIEHVTIEFETEGENCRELQNDHL